MPYAADVSLSMVRVTLVQLRPPISTRIWSTGTVPMSLTRATKNASPPAVSMLSHGTCPTWPSKLGTGLRNSTVLDGTPSTTTYARTRALPVGCCTGNTMTVWL